MDGVGQRGMHGKANHGEGNVDVVQGDGAHGEGPRQKVRQGHSKGGGWNIGHGRGECTGRRPGLWTQRKEE